MITDLDEILSRIAKDFANSRYEPKVSTLSFCLRAAVYKAFIDENELVTNKLLMGAERHEWFGRRFAQYMAERGWVCYPEHKLEFGGIGGRVDMYCVQDSRRVVYEFKFSANTTPTNPFLPFYRRQLMYYMAIDGKINGSSPSGILLVVGFNMNSWYIESVESVDVDEVFNELMQRAEVFKRSIETGDLPPREKGPHCMYCTFRRECLNATLDI